MDRRFWIGYVDARYMGSSMAAFIHQRESLSQGDVVIVECDHQCNVRLMDDGNYRNFCEGRPHHYYGGFYRMLPARIVVPSPGYWNVVLDLGRGRANIKYNISYTRSKSQAVP